MERNASLSASVAAMRRTLRFPSTTRTAGPVGWASARTREAEIAARDRWVARVGSGRRRRPRRQKGRRKSRREVGGVLFASRRRRSDVRETYTQVGQERSLALGLRMRRMMGKRAGAEAGRAVEVFMFAELRQGSGRR